MCIIYNSLSGYLFACLPNHARPEEFPRRPQRGRARQAAPGPAEGRRAHRRGPRDGPGPFGDKGAKGARSRTFGQAHAAAAPTPANGTDPQARGTGNGTEQQAGGPMGPGRSNRGRARKPEGGNKLSAKRPFPLHRSTTLSPAGVPNEGRQTKPGCHCRDTCLLENAAKQGGPAA